MSREETCRPPFVYYIFRFYMRIIHTIGAQAGTNKCLDGFIKSNCFDEREREYALKCFVLKAVKFIMITMLICLFILF